MKIARTILFALCLVWPTAGAAQSHDEELLAEIEFRQELDAQLPLHLEFTNERGERVTLGDYFEEGRPVVLALGYLECPMLCSMTHEGLVRALRDMELDLDDDYAVLSVSIDADETAEQAKKQKEKYMLQYGRSGTEDGWHSLVGSEENIRKVADTVGFEYAYDPRRDEWAHPAGVVVLTPEGRVSHYFYGVDYPADDFRLALVEASDEQIGSPVDRLILRCFHYDPTTGRYNLVVERALQIFGVFTVLLIATMVGGFLWLERRRGTT